MNTMTKRFRYLFWLLPIGLILISYLAILKDLPSPAKLGNYDVPIATKVYDRSGALLYDIFAGENRTPVPLAQIPKYVQQATIAIEDKHFFEHNGVRITSIIRAGISNLIGSKTGSGGASTITQQLIKNIVVGDEHSYVRKIKEAVMAIRLEKKYTKNEILKGHTFSPVKSPIPKTILENAGGLMPA